MARTRLVDLCGVRSGDKGDISDLTLFCDDEEAYEAVLAAVTPAAVATHFGELVRGPVERYEARNVLAIKFVLHDALGGGAPRSLRSDNLGKTLERAAPHGDRRARRGGGRCGARRAGPASATCGLAGAAQGEELVEDRGERVEQRVDVGVGGRPADRHPQAAEGVDAHRLEDGRRLERLGRARAAGVGGDAGAGRGRAARPGARRRRTPRHTRWGSAGRRRVAVHGARPSMAASAGGHPVGEPSLLGSPRPSTSTAPAAAPNPTMAGTFSSPARRARSWSPPTSSGRSRRPAPHEQRAGAGRTAELVRRSPTAGRRRGRRRRSGTWPAACGGVDVDEHAPRRGTRRRPRRPAARVPTSWLPHCTCTSGGVGRAPRRAPRRGRRGRRGRRRRRSPRRARSAAAPHGGVLDRGQHLVPAPLGGPPAGGGDRLGGAAGEHDLRGAAPSSVGDLLAGLLDARPRAASPSAWTRPGSPDPASSGGDASRRRASGRSGDVDAWSR